MFACVSKNAMLIIWKPEQIAFVSTPQNAARAGAQFVLASLSQRASSVEVARTRTARVARFANYERLWYEYECAYLYVLCDLYVLIACAGAMQSGAANWGGGSGSARGDGRWCERWCAIEEVKRATARASEERSRLHVSASVSGHSRSLAFRPNDL